MVDRSVVECERALAAARVEAARAVQENDDVLADLAKAKADREQRILGVNVRDARSVAKAHGDCGRLDTIIESMERTDVPRAQRKVKATKEAVDAAERELGEAQKEEERRRVEAWRAEVVAAMFSLLTGFRDRMAELRQKAPSSNAWDPAWHEVRDAWTRNDVPEAFAATARIILGLEAERAPLSEFQLEERAAERRRADARLAQLLAERREREEAAARRRQRAGGAGWYEEP